MQGVNTDALSAGVVGLGTALAGLAGVVAAPFLSLSPSMSSDVLIDSFVVVVIGGLGSLSGAFVAAMVLGLIQSLGAVYLPEPVGRAAVRAHGRHFAVEARGLCRQPHLKDFSITST